MAAESRVVGILVRRLKRNACWHGSEERVGSSFVRLYLCVKWKAFGRDVLYT